MRKFTVFTLVMFFALLASGLSQTLNLRFNNAFYTWKRVDSLTGSNVDATYTTHLKGYQNLAFDLNFGKWTLSSFVQTDEDIINKIDRGFSFRF